GHTMPPSNVATLAASNPRPVRNIHPDVVARSAMIRDSGRNPFRAPSFPPMVEQAVKDAGLPLIAQDSQVSATFGWAGGDPFFQGAAADGVVFLGYSYLATLAQRAEYRVVTETIASEMTREWIELKVASDEQPKIDRKKAIEDELDRLGAQGIF